jgi:hypothetical protein
MAIGERSEAARLRVERRRRRANIIATLGPATATATTMRQLALAGMDVARVNLAHGTHDDHRRLCELAHSAGEELGHPIAVLARRSEWAASTAGRRSFARETAS